MAGWIHEFALVDNLKFKSYEKKNCCWKLENEYDI